MKEERKLIQLANQCLVVSLPVEIIKKFGLKKSQPVSLKEMGNDLLLSFSKSSLKNKIDLNCSKMNERIIQRMIQAAYKSGIEEIKMKIDPNKKKTIEEYVRGFVGAVILNTDKDSLVIKISLDAESFDFQELLKKAFFLVNESSKEIFTAIEKKDKNKIKELEIDREHVVKHLNLGKLMLNKKNLLSIREANFYFYIFSLLDNICDLYYRILTNSEKNLINKEDMNFFEKTNEMLEASFNLYFGELKIDLLYQLREEIFSKYKQKSYYTAILSTIIKLILELAECKISLDLEKSRLERSLS